MKRPLLGLVTAMLVVSVVTATLPTSGQAEPRPGAAYSDRSASAGEAADAARVRNDIASSVGTDSVLLHVDVAENGSARWRVEYRTRLDDNATAAAFREFQRDRDGESTASGDGFYDRIRGTIAAAEDATGREMAATDFDVETTVRRIPREYGVVVYSFRWHGFATDTDQGLRAGDALSGFFLGPGERLVMSWPAGYEFAEANPTPDARQDRRVVWRGPTAFGSAGPQLRLTENAWPGPRSLPLAAAAVVAGLVAVAWAVRTRGGAPLATVATRLFDDGGEESELLSNEEQVVRLLEDRGGRVKQQEVADELGWTEAKTSYVVSNLRESERIRSFRLGRENVLSLSDSLDVHRSGASTH